MYAIGGRREGRVGEKDGKRWKKRGKEGAREWENEILLGNSTYHSNHMNGLGEINFMSPQ